MAPNSPGQQVGGGAGLGAAGVAVARGSDRFPDGAGLASAAANPLAGVEPVGVLGVLDGGFDLLRRGLALFVALAAALLLPLQLVDLLAQLNAGLDTQLATSGSPLESLSLLGSTTTTASWLVSMLRIVVLSFLGLVAGVMVSDLLASRQRSGGALVAAAARRWWVAALLPLLCVPLKVVGGCAVYVGFFFFDALLMCASVVAGAEGAGPFASFGRSWRLGWRSYGTALGVSFGAFVISVILQAALYLGPAALLGVFVPSEGALLAIQQASSIVLLVTQPLTACIAARAYVEFRCRSEGLDLSIRSNALGLTP